MQYLGLTVNLFEIVITISKELIFDRFFKV